MLTAIFITLIAWYANVPMPLKICTTVFMGLKFMFNFSICVGKIIKAGGDYDD